MTFNRLAEEFKSIHDRFSGTHNPCGDLLSELRRLAALAGRQLSDFVSRGKIEAPSPTPPWWAEGNRQAKQIYPLELFHPFGVNANVNAAKDRAECLAAEMMAMQDAWEEQYRLSLAPQSDDDFLYRHLFYEAATDWLPKRFPERISQERLTEWKVIIKKGKPVYFISDFAKPDKSTDRVPFAIPLVIACRNACVVLTEIAGEMAQTVGFSEKSLIQKPTRQYHPSDIDIIIYNHREFVAELKGGSVIAREDFTSVFSTRLQEAIVIFAENKGKFAKGTIKDASLVSDLRKKLMAVLPLCESPIPRLSSAPNRKGRKGRVSGQHEKERSEELREERRHLTEKTIHTSALKPFGDMPDRQKVYHMTFNSIRQVWNNL